MIERVFAAIMLAVCLAMLGRLVLGARRRARLDAALRRGWHGVRRGVLAVRYWRSARRDMQRARRIADEAIDRARSRATREGNVYTPESFRRPPHDKMH